MENNQHHAIYSPYLLQFYLYVVKVVFSFLPFQALPLDLDSPMAIKQRKRVSLWEEDSNNNEIVSNGDVVGEEVVDEGPNATLTVNEIVGDETLGDEIVDDAVLKERVKRTNIPRVIITGKRRLY
ncbi:hypothetical protein Tco_0751716 [Tanacetum coccineum]|uniref:Uncharacterized protein n=1 Tax=Tanacetum coccineum TaxID=301880 RepID=A0ABQ4Z5U3_9ASTR